MLLHLALDHFMNFEVSRATQDCYDFKIWNLLSSSCNSLMSPFRSQHRLLGFYVLGYCLPLLLSFAFCFTCACDVGLHNHLGFVVVKGLMTFLISLVPLYFQL